MYERFTDRARKVMQLANQEAQRCNHEYIGTEHILLGIIKEASGVAANVLKNLDIDLRKVRSEVEKVVQSGPGGGPVVLGKLPHTPRALQVINFAVDEARNLNHNYVGTEHLLLGLLREREGVAAQVLMNLGLKLEDVREEVLNLLGHKLPADHSGLADLTVASGRSKTPALDEVGHDLTTLARAGDLRPLVGRQAELAAVGEVLACRSRKCPVLLGEPGVGKRTLVAGLARSIAEGRGPERLGNARVVLLPVSELWAGRGGGTAAAGRARAIFDEVRRAGDAILFLPDAIASLGTAAGGPTAERVHVQLLAALWTEQVRCIFTATPTEYQRCLQRHPALAGSVQTIAVRPATVEETVAVLRGVRDRYESHHGVGITDEALAAAAQAADGLPGVLPGKAVQLIDRAAARARIRARAMSPEVATALRDLDVQIEQMNREKEDAVGATDFPRAAERRDRAEALKNEKEEVLQKWHEERVLDASVDAALVAEVARDIAGDGPPAERPII
jgi:ATP-dependent Clp protease ATP-binding subunit ClpC